MAHIEVFGIVLAAGTSIMLRIASERQQSENKGKDSADAPVKLWGLTEAKRKAVICYQMAAFSYGIGNSRTVVVCQ